MAENQEGQLDPQFYERADAQISLANGQINTEVNHGMVSDSFMYGVSRFNAWIAATGFKNGDDMKKEKEEILEFFTTQYRLMLEENFDNYAENYDQYMGVSKEESKK